MVIYFDLVLVPIQYFGCKQLVAYHSFTDYGKDTAALLMTRVFVVLAKTFKKWILNPIRSLHLAPLVFGFMLEKRGGGVIAGFLISSSRSEPALSRVPVVGRKGLGQHHPRTWVLVGAISLKVDSERGWLRTRE